MPITMANDPRTALMIQMMQGQAQKPRMRRGEGPMNAADKLAQAFMMKNMLNDFEGKRASAAEERTNALGLAMGRPAETQTYDNGTTINWNEQKPNMAAALGSLGPENEDLQNKLFEVDAGAKSEDRKFAQQKELLQQKLAAALQIAGMKEGGSGAPSPDAVRVNAEQLGLPVPPTNPFDNPNLDKIGRRQLATSLQKQGQKELDDLGGEISKERLMVNDMKRFTDLNATTDTGGLMGTAIPRTLRSLVDPKVAEMQSLTAKVAPNMRPEGSGATSNYDAQQFERATVGVDKPRETNTNIAKARSFALENKQNYKTFKEEYLSTFGHTRGADGAWQEYLDANPIFDPAKQDFSLNKKRRGWKEFFADRAGKGGSTNREETEDPTSAFDNTQGTIIDFNDLE